MDNLDWSAEVKGQKNCSCPRRLLMNFERVDRFSGGGETFKRSPTTPEDEIQRSNSGEAHP